MWGPPSDIAEYFGGYKCQGVGTVQSYFVTYVEFMANSKLDMNLNLQLSTKTGVPNLQDLKHDDLRWS